MEGVKEFHQLDDQRLHWRASIGGKGKKWTAEIIEQILDHRIAWKSKSDEHTSGQSISRDWELTGQRSR
jgi:uncharacterized membrane protein